PPQHDITHALLVECPERPFETQCVRNEVQLVAVADLAPQNSADQQTHLAAPRLLQCHETWFRITLDEPLTKAAQEGPQRAPAGLEPPRDEFGVPYGPETPHSRAGLARKDQHFGIVVQHQLTAAGAHELPSQLRMVRDDASH